MKVRIGGQRLEAIQDIGFSNWLHLVARTLYFRLREAMNRVRVTNVGDRAIQIERTRQIAKIGNNLNQIARWANTYKNMADTVEIVTHLVAIEQALMALNNLKPKL